MENIYCYILKFFKCSVEQCSGYNGWFYNGRFYQWYKNVNLKTFIPKKVKFHILLTKFCLLAQFKKALKVQEGFYSIWFIIITVNLKQRKKSLSQGCQKKSCVHQNKRKKYTKFFCKRELIASLTFPGFQQVYCPYLYSKFLLLRRDFFFQQASSRWNGHQKEKQISNVVILNGNSFKIWGQNGFILDDDGFDSLNWSQILFTADQRELNPPTNFHSLEFNLGG